ncbi:MAG: SIR2 family protein [Spirosomataceae bacterium]
MPLDFTKPEIQTLINTLNRRKALVIAGTGVSSATISNTERAIFGTWTALLQYGIKFCCEQCRKEENWGEDCRTLLTNETSSTEDLLKIGDEIWDCLQEHGKLDEWLNVFENASPEYPELILAMKGLGVPIATANYDNLLEDITHLTPITLSETIKVEDFLDTEQKQKYILHLHGYFKKPDSVVLGQKSYDAIVDNQFAQFVNRYLVTQFKAVIFIGFGQGVYDQNFSLIFKWVSTYLRNTTLYHIVKDDLVDATKATHNKNSSRNVVVLGYGEKYSDLTPFIKALAHHIEHDDDVPKTLEGKPICIGQNRLELVEKAANYLTAHYTLPAGILGTGGLGKTNLVLNVLHHPSLARKYRRNRYFVRCDGAKDLALLLNALANALEISLSGGTDLQNQLLNYLRHQDSRSLIALDNFETPWDDALHVEPFIEKLKDLADLVFTYRGNASPDDLHWKTFRVPFLNEKDAVALFDSNSEEKFVGHTLVKTLVQEVDYLPLAIELLAKRAKKVEQLPSLYTEWQRKRNDFISKGTNKGTNLNLSISFSYENKNLTDTHRAFLQALGYLPTGINRQDLEVLFEDTYDRLETLKSYGLCEETEQERLWILAPIREYLKQKPLENNPFLEKIQDFYLSMADEKGKNAGSEENSSPILQEEWSNIIQVITDTLDSAKSIDSLFSLTLFCQFSGFYPLDLFKEATRIAHKNQWDLEEANCLRSLGDLAFSQSENQQAFDFYQQALPLYEKIGALLGKANCLKSLGDLAFRQSENERGNGFYEQAVALYKKVNDPYSIGRAYFYWSFHVDTGRKQTYLCLAKKVWLSAKLDYLVKQAGLTDVKCE